MTENKGLTIKEKFFEKMRTDHRYWMGRALYEIKNLPPGEYTGEDIKHLIEPNTGQPSHCNVWGVTINVAVQKGYLTRTGERRAMKDTRSHGCYRDVYNLKGKVDSH